MSEVGGIWGMVQGKGADYKPVPLDKSTQKLVDESVERAIRPTQKVAEEISEGVGASGRSLLQSDQGGLQQATSMAQSPGMLQAIRNQYGKIARDKIGSVVQNNQFRANLIKGENLRQAAQNAMAQQNVINQNYAALTDAYNQAQMARGQVLASALSFGGQAAGMGMAQKPQQQSQTLNQFQMPQMGSQYGGGQQSYLGGDEYSRLLGGR